MTRTIRSMLRKLRTTSRSRAIAAIGVSLGVAVLLVAVVLATGAVTGHIHLGPVDWGNVPTWLSALFSLGTVTGVGVAILTYRQNQKDRRDDERQQARLVQARAVTIGDWPKGDPTTTTFAISIANNSREPVFDVQILDVAVVPFEYYPSSNTAARHAPLHATMWVSDLAYGLHKADRLDTETQSETIHASLGRLGFDAPENIGMQVNCLFEFTDARGRRWQRVGGYRPKRTTTIEDDQPPTDVLALFG